MEFYFKIKLKILVKNNNLIFISKNELIYFHHYKLDYNPY